ncbi:MAG: Uncharacterised protein [Polaribacter sejongensis]|nr:MAG: Uncharacterised protein [Polaribacter sejongensis]
MKKKYIIIVLYIGFISVINVSIQAQTNEKTSRELYQDYIDSIDISNLNTEFILNKGFINDDEITSLYQFIEAHDEETNEVVPR